MMNENTNEPLVSIIVPVYNVEKYLPDFFMSLDNLTYENVEIIIVNDGSTDKSGELVKSYSSKNKKVVLINKPNSGVADARNLALSIYKGDYVYFCDPDDYFSPRIVEVMMSSMLKNKVDLSSCGVTAVKYNSKYDDYKKKKNPYFKEIFLNGTDYIYSILLSDRYFTYGVWNKIFKRSLLEKVENYPNIFDRNCFYGDDILMLAKYFQNVRTAVFVNQILYFNRRRKGSITKSKFNEKILTTNLDENVYSKLDKNLFIESQNHIKTRISVCNLDLIYRIYKSDYSNKEKIREIYHKYVDNIKYCHKGKYNKWYRKYFMWFPKPFIYLMIRNRIK